jgi:hypothetical protein
MGSGSAEQRRRVPPRRNDTTSRNEAFHGPGAAPHAGGIRMTLDSVLTLFRWNRVASVLLAIFIVVSAAEIIVTQVRRLVI